MGSNFPTADRFLKLGSDVKAFVRLVRDRGVSVAVKTVKATIYYRLCAYEGRRFDARFNVETSQPARLSGLTISSGDVVGYEYVGTSPWVTRIGIEQIPEPLKEFLFFDIGCGKGRVILVAAESGFKGIVGIDIAEELIEVARRNVDAYRRMTHSRLVIKLLRCDATTFEWPSEPSVLYYFAAPRDDGGVPTRTLQNAYVSYRAHPRQMYLIVVNDHSSGLEISLPFLERVDTRPSIGNWLCHWMFSLRVYRFQPDGLKQASSKFSH